MFDWPLYLYGPKPPRGELVENVGGWEPGSIIERKRRSADGQEFVEERYVHTVADLAMMGRLYDDFCDPPWHRIQGDLIRLGADPATFSQLTSSAIVAILEKGIPNVTKTTHKKSPPESEAVASGRNKTKEERLTHALLLLNSHPEWTNEKIAGEVGVSPGVLSRWPTFRRAVEILSEDGKRQLPRGWKTSNDVDGTDD